MKVGFILLSSPDRPVPSTRVAVMNMLPLLPALGIDSSILYAPNQASETPALPTGLFDEIKRQSINLVVFQKIRGPSVLALAVRLRHAGIRTCYLVCDLVDDGMVAATDGAVVVTDYLRSLHAPGLQDRIYVVHDGIERPEVSGAAIRGVRPGGPLKAVLVTSAYLVDLPFIDAPPSWLQITVVGPYRAKLLARLRDFRWTVGRGKTASQRAAALRFLFNPRIRCVPWHASGVYDELQHADVGVIPIDGELWDRARSPLPPAWMRKSENRLTLKMAAGLPVVVTSIPSYEAVIVPGVNGYFASDRADWLERLSSLRDPVERKRMGAAARAAVLQRFSMQSQARLLAQAFQSIASKTVDRAAGATVVRSAN